uniref:Uncharacterized protein n=1 Tax=Eutreptiella gymnastica TaxID=73025 RepID=A0A7S4CTR6_9EUGL
MRTLQLCPPAPRSAAIRGCVRGARATGSSGFLPDAVHCTTPLATRTDATVAHCTEMRPHCGLRQRKEVVDDVVDQALGVCAIKAECGCRLTLPRAYVLVHLRRRGCSARLAPTAA